MEPHEILPEPNDGLETEAFDELDSSNEKQASLKLERKQGSPTGSAAISGVAIDDAQGAVQQYQVQAPFDLGATASAGMSIVVPDTAEDLDLIEKAWVQKAKDIVNSTQGDPYVQNKQLNKMKVEYVKQRFNKDIKYDEAA